MHGILLNVELLVDMRNAREYLLHEPRWKQQKLSMCPIRTTADGFGRAVTGLMLGERRSRIHVRQARLFGRTQLPW